MPYSLEQRKWDFPKSNLLTFYQVYRKNHKDLQYQIYIVYQYIYNESNEVNLIF